MENSLSVFEQKKNLRRKIKSRISDFVSNPFKYEEKSLLAENHFLQTSFYKNCDLLFAFVALKSEISTDFILKTALAEKKFVAVPRVISETEMDFFLLQNNLPLENQLVSGTFGIREPADFLEKLELESDSFQNQFLKKIMLVPGLSFSKNGFRLGKGKGFYDRFLAQLENHLKNPLELFGFCFDFQISEEIPHDFFDKPVNHLITENGLVF